jgi:hypothetical protein
MQPSQSEQRIDRICALISALALWALGVMVNIFAADPGSEAGGLAAAGLAPALAPEFRRHLLGINVWLGLAVCLQLGMLLGQRISIPNGLRVALDLFGAFTIGRLILGGPICVTPQATQVAKVLLTAVLFVLLLGVGDRLAGMVRGKDPFQRILESDGRAG